MNVLTINTTTRRGGVGLVTDDSAPTEIVNEQEVTHSEWLVPAIERVLATAHVTVQDIAGIAVAIGPGSFTGLRTGLALAKGMALALHCPVAGVSSLAVLRENVGATTASVVSLIDAQRGEIYGATYRDANIQGDERVLSPMQWRAVCDDVPGELIFVGDGALRYQEVLLCGLTGRAHLAASAQHQLHSQSIATLASTALTRGGDDLAALVPNYVRHSDAEIGFRMNVSRA